MIKKTSLEEFYNEIKVKAPSDVNKEIGHFNVFELKDLYNKENGRHVMPYSRRDYYKISLINGNNKVEYADKIIEIENNALLFATPKIPYHYISKDNSQSCRFCIFSHDFLAKEKVGINIDNLPIFKPGNYPVFHLTEKQTEELDYIFGKMFSVIASDYQYKYDLLRNLVLELIHYGQSLQPTTNHYHVQNASERIFALFLDLLEYQFPIESVNQKLTLRKPKDYADRLAVHVNHLNKAVKETTGKTTSEVICNRIIQEAKILLRQNDWNISEISNALGFEEIAHFSNFFKKQTSLTPLSFRSIYNM